MYYHLLIQLCVGYVIVQNDRSLSHELKSQQGVGSLSKSLVITVQLYPIKQSLNH